MVTMSQLFALITSGYHSGCEALAVEASPVFDGMRTPIVLPRKAHDHHLHFQHLRLVTDPAVFDWKSVAETEMRASLRPEISSGTKRIVVAVGARMVGALEPLPAELLHDWVVKLNRQGYDIQVDIYTRGDSATPHPLTSSPSAVAHYLHTILDR